MRIRAGLISGGEPEIQSSGDSMIVVEFLLGREKYAIDSSFVTEVLSVRNLTQVPMTPNFIAGLMTIRGKIISVVNLVRFFDPREVAASIQKKILVIKYQQMEFAIGADEIKGTKLLDMNFLSTPPVTINKSGAEYIQGVTPERIILLNAVSILTDSRIIINQS